MCALLIFIISMFPIRHIYGQTENSIDKETNYISFHNIEKAWAYSKGKDVKVAVLDWMFDIKSDTSQKYINPTSLVPGQDIGIYEAWHGEWMAEIIHTIAPEAKIIPIRARPARDGKEKSFIDRPYEKYILQGIKFAADQGAVVVTNSMGPLKQSAELDKVIEYAANRGTVFIDVHPEYITYKNDSYVLGDSLTLNKLIIHSGIIPVPEHPARRHAGRDIYTWPYQINPKYKDGWGYSNGPPIIAGVIALMKSLNKDLTIDEIKNILIRTARKHNEYKVLDAEEAVKEVLKK